MKIVRVKMTQILPNSDRVFTYYDMEENDFKMLRASWRHEKNTTLEDIGYKWWEMKFLREFYYEFKKWRNSRISKTKHDSAIPKQMPASINMLFWGFISSVIAGIILLAIEYKWFK